MIIFSYATVLFVFWLLLSGHTSALMLFLGLSSVILTVILIRRMTLIDHESYPVHLSSNIPKFMVFIFKEILKANVDVIKRIMTFRRSAISPQLFEVPVTLNTDLGRVIYANSITLTPGTVSVELDQEKILVHALTHEAADELASGKMAESIPDKTA